MQQSGEALDERHTGVDPRRIAGEVEVEQGALIPRQQPAHEGVGALRVKLVVAEVEVSEPQLAALRAEGVPDGCAALPQRV